MIKYTGKEPVPYFLIHYAEGYSADYDFNEWLGLHGGKEIIIDEGNPDATYIIEFANPTDETSFRMKYDYQSR